MKDALEPFVPRNTIALMIVYSGSCLSVLLAFPPSPLANTLHMKYEDLLCCIEIIDDINDPIGHMNKFCSNHTDSIVTKNCNYLII
ncbi:unnamed protein product [Rotaria sp. Silwood1]|nr:unnamed protein product [Rotaria sp. Silwood1]